MFFIFLHFFFNFFHFSFLFYFPLIFQEPKHEGIELGWARRLKHEPFAILKVLDDNSNQRKTCKAFHQTPNGFNKLR